MCSYKYDEDLVLNNLKEFYEMDQMIIYHKTHKKKKREKSLKKLIKRIEQRGLESCLNLDNDEYNDD